MVIHDEMRVAVPNELNYRPEVELDDSDVEIEKFECI